MDLSPTTNRSALSEAGSPLTIEQSAELVGAWAWAEGTLYEVVGGWVRSAWYPPAKVYFDACSQHHAWRAQLFQERLSGHLVAAGGSAGDLVKPFSSGAVATMKALSYLEGDVERLAAYCRVVLARTVVAYRSWQSRFAGSSDRPVARALRFATDDTLADWEQGAALLVELLDGAGGLIGPSGAEAVVRAAEASSELERLLVGKGPAPGA